MTALSYCQAPILQAAQFWCRGPIHTQVIHKGSFMFDPPVFDLCVVRATLPSALNAINASSVGKLVQLVTASRLTLYHEGRIDPMKDECHYQVKH